MSRPTFSDPVGVFALANVLLFFACLLAFPPGAILLRVSGYRSRRLAEEISAVRRPQQGVLRTHQESVTAR